MKCSNCVNYDGLRCEVKFDENDEYLVPKGVVYCPEFEIVGKKYVKEEDE